MRTKGKWEIAEPVKDIREDIWTCLIWIDGERKGGISHPLRAYGLTREECLANAEYICKAVNNFERMKDTFYNLLSELEIIEGLEHLADEIKPILKELD